MENDLLKSMARRIIAGKEPPAQDPAQPVAPEQAAPAVAQPAPTPNSEKAFDVKRVYYFNAPGDKAIPFNGLSASLASGSADKDATISKLKGGSGDSRADYFTWQKMILKTNKYDPSRRQYVTYTCNLTGFGGKASSDINPAIEIPGVGRNKDDVIKHIEEDKDLGVFKDNIQGDNIINLDASSDSVYYNAAKSGIRMTFEDVKGLFDNYRVWGNNNMLMLPDMTKPTKDDIPGGYYFGGPAAFNRFVAPTIGKQEAPAQGATPGQPATAPATTPFEPVDEQGAKTPAQGQSATKMAKKTTEKRPEGDYSSVPYSGGTDVVQRLFYDQAKHMKIRQAARRVAGRYLKEALDEKGLDVTINNPKFFQDKAKLMKEEVRLDKAEEAKPELKDDPIQLGQRAQLAKRQKGLLTRYKLQIPQQRARKAEPRVFPEKQQTKSQTAI